MSEKQMTFFTVNCAEKFESPNQWYMCHSLNQKKLKLNKKKWFEPKKKSGSSQKKSKLNKKKWFEPKKKKWFKPKKVKVEQEKVV
jgi:hypothetical protein